MAAKNAKTDVVVQATAEMTTYGLVYVTHVGNERRIALERQRMKGDIIKRLVGTDNPLTTKPHSETSASAAASLDPEYMAMKERHVTAELATLTAKIHYDGARIRAEAEARR